MSTDLITRDASTAYMPVLSVGQAIERRAAMVELVRRLMVENQHYGKISGSAKDTLYKAGAEMLCTFFGLTPTFAIEEKEADWSGEHHGGEPFFYYRYKCQLYRAGALIGEGVGSCNSWESKYRYRQAERVCPQCGTPAIIKGKAEYGGGWLCFGKRGGCGAKFQAGDSSIEGQATGRVSNPDPADLVNTIDKMAQKRALVAATLIGANASEFFTQDLEDFAHEYTPPAVITGAPVAQIAPITPEAFNGTLAGPVSGVQTAYSKAGALTLSFTLGGRDCLYLKAPDYLLHLADGDRVRAQGEERTHKGTLVVSVTDLQAVDDPDLWITRAKAGDGAVFDRAELDEIAAATK